MPIEQTLRRAIAELRSERAKIDEKIRALETVIWNNSAPGRGRRKGRKMSAKARAAIGKRMKAYWAKRRKTKAS